MNPFTFGNPINDPARFYGRKAEIRQIVNRLSSSAHESTSIIGERRIGKTSLFNYLTNPEIAAGLGLSSDKFCFVYVDFQGLTDITPQRFWQRVLKKISRSICDESLKPAIDELSTQSEFDLFDLEDLFETTRSKGQTIVLLMDEFEYITENPNFKNDFFGGLRALAIHHGLALVPSTRRELIAMCHSDEIKGSPFFNIFANVVLRPFSRTEVDELIEGYTQESDLIVTQDEKDFIWGLGGGNPFFVQMAGHYLIEGKAQGLTDKALTDFGAENFNEQAEAHFSESEKITLLVILTLTLQKQTKKTIPNVENLSKLRARAPQDLVALSKRGLVDERDGVYHIFSLSLENWIRHEILAAPGEQESQKSAEEWLGAGGQNEVKETRNVFPHFKKKYWPLMGAFFKDLTIEAAAALTLEFVKTIW
jgi:AAA+ ATPase superfamily predicted ATPase